MKMIGRISRAALLSGLFWGFVLCAGPAAAQKDDELQADETSSLSETEEAASKPNHTPNLAPAMAFSRSAFQEQNVRDRASDIVNQSQIQSTLPVGQTPPEPLNWDLSWLMPIFKIIGWVVIAAFVVGMLVLAFVMFSGIRFDRKVMGGGAADGLDPKQNPIDDQPLWSRDALGRADQLAKNGNFEEAVHVLLLGSLGELKAKFFANLPTSFTSREIVAKISMPEGAKSALSILILSVEISLFGDSGLERSDYDTCRSAFLRFAEPGA